MRQHLTKCLLAGLVAILPVGGLILILVKLDTSLDALWQNVPFDFPGRGILTAVLAIYLLGLTITTFVGRWLWTKIDSILEQLPGLSILYQTLKQILGYGSGKDALFRHVVFVKDSGTETLELGLVTDELRLPGHPMRWVIFIPGSPNPALGRMVLLEPEKCMTTKIPVDVAFKALLSTGKTGLEQSPESTQMRS